MIFHSRHSLTHLHSSDQWKRLTNTAKTFKSLDTAFQTTSVPPHLACFLCKKVLRDAVTSPCCRTNFCDEDIQRELVETGLQCPKCRNRLKPNEVEKNMGVRRQVDEWIRSFTNKPSSTTSVPNSNEPVPRERDRAGVAAAQGLFNSSGDKRERSRSPTAKRR